MSSAINQQTLVSPEDVIQRYHSLKGVAKASTLAVRLAREAYFGDDVLGKCTVAGFRDDHALPVAELNRLKEKLFPEYWGNPTVGYGRNAPKQ